MDYIYHGELKIYQEDIDRFLEIAQRFKLEGLTPPESPSNESIDEERKVATSIQDQSTYFADESNIKTSTVNERKMVVVSNSDIDTIYKLDQKVLESYSRDEDGQFSCHYCARIFKRSNHIKEHVEVHFDGLILKCDRCEKTCTSRSALRNHVYRVHNNFHKTQ